VILLSCGSFDEENPANSSSWFRLLSAQCE
jgi:hypothetical protein